MMQSRGGENWHSLPADDAIRFFGTDAKKGLDTFEVENRRERFGANVLTERKGRGPVVRFLLQVHQPLIYILIASAIVTAVLGEWVDSAVIWGIVIINAVVGFVQEAKALTAIAALKRALMSEATVLRAGTKVRLLSSELVPGDIVFLQSGDKVPADLRLVRSKDLQIDESALTGESVSAMKGHETLKGEMPLADRKNIAYTSTLVTYGTGEGVVIATGDSTEIGRVSEMIATAEVLATPLTRKIEHFSKWLLIAIMVLAGVTLGIGILRGHTLFDTFMAAVALAVGAIPEGLPAAVTIILAIGVGRMAKRRAIIRRLPAVETLGSTTVVCSDKTGTLTKNQMTVKEVVAGGTRYGVSGAGYAPSGDITREGKGGANEPPLMECLRAGLLCNDSTLTEEEEGWKVHGDPTEGALITAALKGGLSVEGEGENLPRVDTIPFESQHHFMATMHDPGAGKRRVVYLKGSMESLLPRCDAQLGADGAVGEIEVDAVNALVEKMASQGLRILVFARKELSPIAESLKESDIKEGLTFLGLQAMIDPPRPEAVQAIRACQSAGIRVKMITGDHAITATAIARELGIAHDGIALTSADLDGLSDEEFTRAALETDVFARMSPEQKFRLVEALQANGHVIAMTGDGVNDAPSLRRADIGIAMGRGGTEVAREASDMVLTDDNFATIEAAVEEGRGVFDNLLKFIVWTVPANLGEGLVLMLAIFLGVALPITPVQILWINMTTAGCLGLMLAFEPMESDIMGRKPRDPRKPLLSVAIITRITIVSFLLCIGSFVLYEWARSGGLSQEQARTIAVNVFVVGELFYLFSCRSLTRSMFAVGMFSNWWIWIGVAVSIALQVAFTYAPLMNRLFHTAAFPATEWIKIVAVGSLISVAVAVDKLIVKAITKERPIRS